MKSISLGFSMLNLYRKTHNDCATEGNSFVNMLDRAELDVSDPATSNLENILISLE